jgi:4-hydroxy-tetrahydrodipicolinate synthase
MPSWAITRWIPFAGPSYQAKYFLELADASTVPVIAYVRSDTFSVADFRNLALHPNIAGIKFASGNLMLLADVIRSTKDAPAIWVCGLAEGWAPAFYAMGARGFTSGLVNVFPERSHAIHTALEGWRLPGSTRPYRRHRGLRGHAHEISEWRQRDRRQGSARDAGDGCRPVRVPGVER